MTKYFRFLLAMAFAFGALTGAETAPALSQTLAQNPGQTSKKIPRRDIDRQVRELSADIQKRNERLQILEREVGAMRRNKAKAPSEKNPRFNAKIDRLKDQRDRLHKANQLDTIKRNSLRGNR